MKVLTPLQRATAVLLGCAMATFAAAETAPLPLRAGPAPVTTDSVPHVQIDVEPVPEISLELLRRVDQIEGVDIRPTVISLPGTRGFWLDEAVETARPEAIVGGREFAHLHPDGSLHASLSPDLAVEAVAAGWATHHPWADERPGWEGFVMIYTPASPEELETVVHLVMESFRYITGSEAVLR